MMNGVISKTVAGVCLGLGLVGLLGGCCRYQELVDPCWPERYNYQARHAVMDTWNAQAYNGHVLDQTIWNWHFEADPKSGAPTDKLNPAGLQHLQYLARRQPAPDGRVFVQTAQEIAYDPAQSEGTMKKRAELDAKRQEAVHKFLSFASMGRHGSDFLVQVIDPGEVGIAAMPIGGNRQTQVQEGSIGKMYLNFQGVMPSTAGSLGGAGGTSSSGTSK